MLVYSIIIPGMHYVSYFIFQVETYITNLSDPISSGGIGLSEPFRLSWMAVGSIRKLIAPRYMKASQKSPVTRPPARCVS